VNVEKRPLFNPNPFSVGSLVTAPSLFSPEAPLMGAKVHASSVKFLSRPHRASAFFPGFGSGADSLRFISTS